MRYVAFFRGINVGGKNIVKMADLKKLFSDLGFWEVITYLQSGNVIFSSENNRQTLSPLIANAFAEHFGFQSAVVIRSSAEIANIADSVPYKTEEIEQTKQQNPDAEHLYVYLSDTVIDSQEINQLCADYKGEDKLYIKEYDIYLLCHQSIRDSKLAAKLAKLQQPSTARNLKTINKIKSLL